MRGLLGTSCAADGPENAAEPTPSALTESFFHNDEEMSMEQIAFGTCPQCKAGTVQLFKAGYCAHCTIAHQETQIKALQEVNASKYVGGIPAGCKLICEKCGADSDSPCGWPAHCESRISPTRSSDG